MARVITMYFFAAVLLLLAGCFAGGILNMDERWCAKHPNAPVSRCDRR